MPCLEAKDLSQLAEQHITSQKATITNLRARKTELEAEEKRLNAQPDADTNPRLKQVREAVNHLRLELDGEIESPAGSRNFVKDPVKKTAEERVEVMAALYRERTLFEFHDTTKVEGKERKASVFGLPTVEEMQRLQHKDVADAIMVRATSLLLQRQDGRNPVDFLDTTGLDVKVPLANVVEHHHIYNNVHLNENGRVEFKLFDRQNGWLSFDKGHVEKEDHTVYRPLMNSEIQKHYVRETLSYLEREYGENALQALQDTARRQYQQNILERLGALQDKVRGKVAVTESE